MTEMMAVTTEMLDGWADDPQGPVALHLRQHLLPVEGRDGIVFPATYAFEDGRALPPYQIDRLSDGTKVAQIDSVGAQANRMEPSFRAPAEGRPSNPLAALVPQIEISLGNGRSVSILDAGHRLGDALVRASALRERAQEAFAHWRDRGDATAIAKLAPTSLVFGAWDSRGEGAKVPRIVQAVIRGWDVEPLTRSAQYTPPVDYAALAVFSEEDQKRAEGDSKDPRAQRGFVPVPAVGTHGGILVRGEIVRDVTINLIALRQLDGIDGPKLRRYIFGLGLVAATTAVDAFLRQGCLLTLDPDRPSSWTNVERSGRRTAVDLTAETALSYARSAASAFGVGESGSFAFTKDLAAADLKESEARKKSRKPSK